MKVILLKDVAKIGRRGSVVEVPDGYAQNKLLPNKMAKPATEENVRFVQNQDEVKSHAYAQGLLDFKKMVELLGKERLVVEVKTNEAGHMFEALKNEAIAKAILQHTGIPHAVADIYTKSPIKSEGEHTLTLKYGKESSDVIITITRLQ